MEEHIRHVADILANGTEVVFHKPGKEAFRKKNPKPHDMTPVVPGYEWASFRDVWSILAWVSFAEPDAFKALAVLIYRSAYHLDHVAEEGKLRYRPAPTVASCMDALDQRLAKFMPNRSVRAFLHFLDLLGWNEDVKYHFEDGKVTFTGDFPFKAGRVNTLLTCIRVPYEVSRFARHAVENASSPERIEFGHIIDVMQQFSIARGTCVPDDDQLLQWFAPYLRR